MGGPRHREGGEGDSSPFAFGLYPVPDNIFAVNDDADPTKIFKLDVGTNVPTGTTVVGTVPASNFTFAGLEIANVFTANQTISTNGASLNLNTSSLESGIEWRESGTARVNLWYDPGANALETTLKQAGDTWDIYDNGFTRRVSISQDAVVTLTSTNPYISLVDSAGGAGCMAYDAGVGTQFSQFSNTDPWLWVNSTPAVVATLTSAGALNIASHFKPDNDATQVIGDSGHRWGLFSGTTAIFKPTSDGGTTVTAQDSSGNRRGGMGTLTSSSNYFALYGPDTPGNANWILCRAADATNQALYINASNVINFDIASVDYLQIQSAKMLPFNDNAFDLADGSNRFRDGYFSRNLKVDGSIRFPAGTISAPGIALSDATGTGFYRRTGTDILDVAINGSGPLLEIQSAKVYIGANLLPYNATESIGSTSEPFVNVCTKGYIEGVEMTAPSAPAANSGRIFFQDNGAGKTQLMVIFNTGAAQQIAIQP